MANNNKVKGLLKGLRYISQIFENEKEPEMQIGLPTDVKHVAHIGWDGPSVNTPSWMNEFKQSGGGYSSAPLNPPGDLNDDGSVKWVSEDRKVMMSPARDIPELPKSSRRPSSTGAESPTKDKPRQARRASRNSSNGAKTSRHQKVPSEGGEPGSLNVPDLPKKTRRKKSKDCSAAGSSSRSSRSKSQANDQADTGSESGSVSKATHSNEQCHTSALTNLEGGEETGYTRIS